LGSGAAASGAGSVTGFGASEIFFGSASGTFLLSGLRSNQAIIAPPVWAEFAITSRKLIVKTRDPKFGRKLAGGTAK
jgi:hypothetical protein